MAEIQWPLATDKMKGFDAILDLKVSAVFLSGETALVGKGLNEKSIPQNSLHEWLKRNHV